LEHKKTEQAHFIFGFPAFSRMDERRYALTLLGIALGGNMSSRLFTEVREKRGLCYYIHSDVDFYHDTGVFGASAGVDPQRVDEAVKVTREEFIKIREGKDAFSAAELQKAKEYVAGQLILSLEDSESVAQFFGMRQLLHGQVQSPEELLKKYQAVTLEDVRSVAEAIIQPDAARFAIIGPFDKAERFTKILEIATPAATTTKKGITKKKK
jgi:predicted Zn-dependent peptidase